MLHGVPGIRKGPGRAFAASHALAVQTRNGTSAKLVKPYIRNLEKIFSTKKSKEILGMPLVPDLLIPAVAITSATNR